MTTRRWFGVVLVLMTVMVAMARTRPARGPGDVRDFSVSGVTMKPGFYTGWAHDALLVNSTSKGGHGFDPARPELKATLVLAGPDVPKAGDLGLVSMTRIAPTVAKWFDVRLSPEADRPLELAVPDSVR